MKKISLVLSDSQVEALRDHYFAELADTPPGRDVAELSENEEKLREKVADVFEAEGYEKQAREMRTGAMPVEEFADKLDVPTQSDENVSEIIGDILVESVDGLELNV
jgi:hypothetical protein